MQKGNKLKILLCSPLGGFGGIAVWTTHVLNYFETFNKDVEIKWCYSDNKYQSFANTNFIKRLFNALMNYIPFIQTLIKVVKQEHYDVVHFTTSASISLLKDIITLKICKRKHIKTIIHFHFGRIPEIYKKKNWEKRLLHKVIKLSDCAIVIDKLSYETLYNEGYNNICILQNPLSLSVYEIINNNNDIKRENRKIVFAGHVVPTKGIYELIKACKNIPNIVLKVIGTYSDKVKNNILDIAGKNSNKWLYLEGNKQHHEVIKEMLSANLFVLPTYTEGFPNVIIEAMACGCTIITTPVGAIPEMMNFGNKPCGVCINVGDVKDLKDKIEYYLENNTESTALGDSAKKRVKEMYSMENIMEKLINIWMNTNNANC